MLHTKQISTIEDVTPEGQVTALVAQLNVVDKDGDVTLPGFFGTQPTRMVWGHRRDVWIGKGTLTETDSHAAFHGQFFMDTQAGAEAFKAVRGMGELAEWSYGFRLLDGGAKTGEHDGRRVRFLQPRAGGTPGVIVDEVSPVLVGAGEGTRTVSLKWAPGEPLPDAATLAQFIKAALGQVDGVAQSVTALHEHLTEGGHSLSDAKATVLAELVEGLEKALAAVSPVLAMNTPQPPDTEPADTMGLRAAHDHLLQLSAVLR